MLATIINAISDFMYGKLLISMLLLVGFYYTIRTGFIQLSMFRETLRVIVEKPKDNKGVSSFHALMVSTASRVGTGNIVGVSTAICVGGFGSIFWMWLTAFIGGASAFVESTLAQIYKKHGEQSSYGGPAYYIENAIHSRFIAILFSFSLIATYGIGFNMLCSYNLQSTFSGFSWYDKYTTPWEIGAILAILVGLCLFGGSKRIIKTTSILVPIMGILYLIIALIVTFLNLNMLPQVFTTIFSQAFDFQAIFGGFSGSCVMLGIKRGLYSNEAGIGSAPNAAAAADVSHPVKQGLVQMFSVFIDTILLCSATAFICMTSGVTPTKELAGTPYVLASLTASFGSYAGIFLTCIMVLFAFSTLIGNLYYVDNCLAYINRKMPSNLFMSCYRIFASAIIFIGAGLSVHTLWDLADVFMGCMAIINMPAIVMLGNTAMKCLKDYRKQIQEGKNPVFIAKHIGLNDKLDYWQE